MADIKKELQTRVLPMIALRGLVLYPKMVLHFDVAREKSILALNEALAADRLIFLTAQKDVSDDNPGEEDIYHVGVVASIKQVLKSQNDKNVLRVLVEGIYRGRVLEVTSTSPYFLAKVEEYPLKSTRIRKSMMCDALMRTVKDLFEEYCYLTPKMPRELVAGAMVSDDPVYLAEYIAANILIKVEDKQKILSESNVVKRLSLLASILESENDILNLERDIYDKVREQIDKNQREYYLREQMRIISSELGEDENVQEEAQEYRAKILKLKLSEENEQKLLSETDRLGKMPPNSHEASVIRSYLDICLGLPWNTATKDKVDVAAARRLLDREHYGLDKVKERVLELIAVHKLAPDMKGQIICLVGPPGVGKTSIARSIAKAMGRKYARMALGGVRDESDIRGHRKTYIGAMPGRIINAIKQAGSNNPLILLDEVDKLGNDFRGDPSSALLEVLDAEQNVNFRDHYIEIPFDLSHVLFVATANTLDTIPAPLLDRMEVIELTSYTREEKFHIAKKYLVKKQMSKYGLNGKMLAVPDKVLYDLIDYYTREAGVRSLEREIASLCRKAAKQIVSQKASKVVLTPALLVEMLGPHKFKDDELEKEDQVGVVNGLAWTSVGGELLQVEVAVLEGSGKLELTGSLGDVMKESAQAAVSVIRGCAARYGVEADFYKTKDIHIHFPEGAVPKDGPSAGITICTALLSALIGAPVRHDLAMTGEITLRGRVLPIGGLKEKTMAAYRNKMKTVLIPKANEPDLAEIDPVVRQALEIIPVARIETVFSAAIRFPAAESANTSERSDKELPPPKIGEKPHSASITQ